MSCLAGVVATVESGKQNKFLANVISDCRRVGSIKGFVDLWANGIGNEFQKWFGHRAWLWDAMYKHCNYEEKMKCKSQQARNIQIATFLGSCSAGNVLDVGSGTCNALDTWRSVIQGKYCGLDISETAIKIAGQNFADQVRDGRAEFVCSSMQDYQPSGLTLPDERGAFNVIIFNCSLDVNEAVSVLLKARDMLVKDGVIIICMSQTSHAKKIWDAIGCMDDKFRQRARIEVRSEEGNAWDVGCFEAVQ